MGEKINNAHFDTSFASIDPKIINNEIMKIIEGTYSESENCIKSY